MTEAKEGRGGPKGQYKWMKEETWNAAEDGKNGRSQHREVWRDAKKIKERKKPEKEK
jgi:hypothetical protein